MERVVVNNFFVNIFTMQVCAVKDATDEEILQVCNSQNPAGTRSGWSKVIRTSDDHDMPEALPVQCAEDPDRLHYLVSC